MNKLAQEFQTNERLLREHEERTKETVKKIEKAGTYDNQGLPYDAPGFGLLTWLFGREVTRKPVVNTHGRFAKYGRDNDRDDSNKEKVTIGVDDSYGEVAELLGVPQNQLRNSATTLERALTQGGNNNHNNNGKGKGNNNGLHN